MKTVDRRVQKTNQALQLAFRKLASTTSYRNLTVKQLTQEAHINRKTFYLHYDSIEDFSDTIVEEIANKLLDIITDKPLNETLTESGYIFDRIFSFFQESREFYTFMMTSDDYSFLARKVEHQVVDGFTQGLYDSFDISRLDAYICANFLIRNTLMLFRVYSGHDVELDRNEFRDRLVRLNSSGLSSFINVSRRLQK